MRKARDIAWAIFHMFVMAGNISALIGLIITRNIIEAAIAFMILSFFLNMLFACYRLTYQELKKEEEEPEQSPKKVTIKDGDIVEVNDDG